MLAAGLAATRLLGLLDLLVLLGLLVVLGLLLGLLLDGLLAGRRGLHRGRLDRRGRRQDAGEGRCGGGGDRRVAAATAAADRGRRLRDEPARAVRHAVAEQVERRAVLGDGADGVVDLAVLELHDDLRRVGLRVVGDPDLLA